MEDFNKIYNRKKTNCSKWDSIEETYGERDLLPLWIADMDFKVNQSVLNALKKTVDQGILGYTSAPKSLYLAVQSWQKRQHNYLVEKESILFNSGVVPSLSLCVQAYTEPGDAVMIHDPVYPPFTNVIKQNKRKIVRSELLEEKGHFTMNFKEMEELIISEKVRLFIFCNPHNPGGRVWNPDELKKLGALCLKHNVILISDEIHQDLIFAPHTFTTFNNVDPTFKEFSVILTAATKTFNLAGIKNSMVFIDNTDLRQLFVTAQQKNQQHEINTFGYVGTEAAYENGDTWLEELLDYIQTNIAIVAEYLATELPEVKMMKPEGTYLIWLDFSAFNLTDTQLQEQFIHKGKVVLNPGISFGPSGTQHMRLNVACPKEILLEGLFRIKKALK